MKKNKIEFPVLYDTRLFLGEELIDVKRGYCNYETNIFEIPKKDFEILNKNPKLSLDLEVITGVGYMII